MATARGRRDFHLDTGKARSSYVKQTNARSADRIRKHKPDPKCKPDPKRKPDSQKTIRISRLRRPEELSLEAWQIALRRQFGLEQDFRVRNIGDDPVFSEFEVNNPQTRRSYRVVVRGEPLGESFCSCPDFAVNTLGTCKHIECVLGRLRRSRKTRAALAAGFRPDYSEIYVHYGPRRDVRFKPGADCPISVTTEARRYFDAAGILKPAAYAKIEKLLSAAPRRGHEIRCYDDVLDLVAQHRDRAALTRRIDRMFPGSSPGPVFADLLKLELYPFQREGALFAARTGRCLIADDMGLGKTIQAIAAAEILARLGAVERVLVISPTSLKHQWQREIEKFCGRSSLIVEGLLAERARRYAAESFFKITNYDVIHRDLEEIRRWQPDLVILDEAQRIKNWKTRAAKSVKQIKSDHAFVLTGTPLENRLEELYSIVEFVDRFRLGPMFRFLAEHQHVNEHGRVIGYRNLSSVAQTLQPILIRRRKGEVLKDLPERLEKRFFVAMTAKQMEHHEENREIVGQIVCRWRRRGFLSESDQRKLMIALQNMRMSCDSTFLLDHVTDHGVKADELAELLGEILEDPSTKVVVFSQWLRMHELIVRRLSRRKWDHVLFHGGVPGRARKQLVDRFRDDPGCRLFLSTDAGGVGLNLQAASVVINMDQPWNPAILEQRVGRVHRLGQHRPVQVIDFIAQGTIEEGMLGLLAFKQSMFSGILDGGQDEVFLGGTRLAKFMEGVEQATGAIPVAMPAASEVPDGATSDGGGADGRQPDGRRPGGGRSDDGSSDGGVSVAGAVGSEEEAEEEAVASFDATWGEVISAGASLLEKLTMALEAGRTGTSDSESGRRGDPKRGRQGDPRNGPAGETATSLPSGLVGRDEGTGEPYLRVPVPKPETLRKIVDLLAALRKG